jgi:hypothetical protein
VHGAIADIVDVSLLDPCFGDRDDDGIGHGYLSCVRGVLGGIASERDQ